MAFPNAGRAITDVRRVERSPPHDHRPLAACVLAGGTPERALTAGLLVAIGAPAGRCPRPPTAPPRVPVGPLGREVRRLRLGGHPVDPRRPVLPGPARGRPPPVPVEQVRPRRARPRWILVRQRGTLLACGGHAVVRSPSLPAFPPAACAARRRLPARGSPGPRVPTFRGPRRRDDGHPAPLGPLRVALAARVPCWRPSFVVSVSGSWPGGSPPRPRQGSGVSRRPRPAPVPRRPVALPRSRVPPVLTGPALRPRWCPPHSPSRVPDGGLPRPATRRLAPRCP